MISNPRSSPRVGMMVWWGMESDPVVAPEIAAAIADDAPVVALETTLIAHGLPYPYKVSTGSPPVPSTGSGRLCWETPATFRVWCAANE